MVRSGHLPQQPRANGLERRERRIATIKAKSRTERGRILLAPVSRQSKAPEDNGSWKSKHPVCLYAVAGKKQLRKERMDIAADA